MAAICYDDFAALFSLTDDILAVESVNGSKLPAIYFDLLNHSHHMTVTVERFFDDNVDVIVQDWDQTGDDYSRKILLKTIRNQQFVQFGVVRIRLDVLPVKVRDEIISESMPLGRILISNGVLTRVEPIEFLKVSLGPHLTTAFQCPYPETSYGRIGLITANGLPAIEVLEVLRPI